MKMKIPKFFFVVIVIEALICGFLLGMFYKRDIDNAVFVPKQKWIKILRPHNGSGEGLHTSDGTFAHMVRDSAGRLQCVVITDSTINTEWVSFE